MNLENIVMIGSRSTCPLYYSFILKPWTMRLCSKTVSILPNLVSALHSHDDSHVNNTYEMALAPLSGKINRDYTPSDPDCIPYRWVLPP